MKMWASAEQGGPDQLKLIDAADPVAAPSEVIVDVAACGINFPDSLIIQDLYQFRPERPFAPGGEIAGTILEVGADVVGLVAGDRVLARIGWGGLAQRVAVPAAKCAKLPPTMSFEEGSAFLFTYATAYHALVQRGRIAAGERLLVLGGAGGTGVATIELGKAFGATVCAAVSSEEKAEFARQCGADETIIYPSGPLDRNGSRALGEDFKRFAGSHGIDMVFDPVGGDYAEPALRAMAWKGRYLVVGFTAGIPRLPFNLPLLKGCEIVGVFNGGLNVNEPDVADANVRALLDLYAQGKVRPRISRVFEFGDAPAAIEAIAGRGALGKLVVRVGAPVE